MKPLRFSIISLFLLLVFAFAFPVYADMGPKPSIKIILKNPPSEPYYLDLLIQKPGTYDNLGESRTTLDKGMLELLKSQDDNGWYPALSEGTTAPLWGELTGRIEGNTRIHEFNYVGVPTVFKIIIVTKSAEVHVSKTIRTFLFQSTINFDITNSSIILPNFYVAYLFQFISTFIPTLLIEGLLLFLYRLWTRKNLKTILMVNFVTQVGMTAIVGTYLLKHGMLSAMIVLLLVEPTILIVEALVYRITLEKGTKWHYVAYAIVANLASAFIGLMMVILN